MWESDIGTFPVSRGQGDEWVFHLTGELADWDGMRIEGSYSERVVIAERADGTTSTLRVRVEPECIRCTVVGDGDEAEEDRVRRWREAAATAAAELGRHDEDFGWQAVLGPNPRRMELLKGRPLAGPARLGPVLLEPGGIQMLERTGWTQADISPYLARYSWPVIASGSVPSYHFLAADLKAKFDLHRTCALLTLLWDGHWVPRTGPQVPLPGSHPAPLQVPQYAGNWGHAGPVGSVSADFNTYDGTEPLLEIPEWAEGAWAALDADPVLATAVSAHYEARSLDYDHPSAAYLGYVAAIEGIGSKLADLTECEACGSHTGARRRFRKALRTVMTSKAAGKLEYAYDVRSATGHDGTMFGSEEILGHGWISIFDIDTRSAFDTFLLGEIRNASRRVVTRALMNALGVDAAID